MATPPLQQQQQHNGMETDAVSETLCSFRILDHAQSPKCQQLSYEVRALK
jgi:hypothetical protein